MLETHSGKSANLSKIRNGENYEVLHNRYNENKSMVCEHLKSIISKCNLSGQWSIDVTQNGSEFYIIDMQETVNSTYYNETVKEDLRKSNSECWVPDLSIKKDRRILKKLKHERKISCFLYH